jgi:hypothetical protein
VKLILTIPLKTANRQFTLYKILALPTPILNGTFMWYLPEFAYFVIDHVQRNYVLLTEAEFRKCTLNSIAVCPA